MNEPRLIVSFCQYTRWIGGRGRGLSILWYLFQIPAGRCMGVPGWTNGDGREAARGWAGRLETGQHGHCPQGRHLEHGPDLLCSLLDSKRYAVPTRCWCRVTWLRAKLGGPGGKWLAVLNPSVNCLSPFIKLDKTDPQWTRITAGRYESERDAAVKHDTGKHGRQQRPCAPAAVPAAAGDQPGRVAPIRLPGALLMRCRPGRAAREPAGRHRRAAGAGRG